MMISIVIPVYNNERQLVELNNRIDKALEDMPYELVLIDDASTDDSLNLIKSLKEKNDAIQIIINENNIGQQLTTLTGIKSAIGSSIVVLDADLQDDPDLIPSLVSYLLNDSTAAFIRRKGIYQSMSRMFTSTIIKMIIYMISGLHY
ncbi:MAG: glycosyltransferase, partial [Bacteroidia bacterium]|nr:glycosyltransferase [Bacteroidia bacterium]